MLWSLAIMIASISASKPSECQQPLSVSVRAEWVSDDELVLFQRISGAVRLTDGRFIVGDGAELRLAVFAPDGQSVTSWGRGGDGPGEFRSIGGIWVEQGDTIGVWDPRAHRVTRFEPDGSVARVDPIRFGPGGSPVPSGHIDAFLGAFGDGRVALGWLVMPQPEPNRTLADRMVFGVFDRDGRFVRLLGDGTGMVRFFTERSGSGPFVFSPFPWPAVVNDSLAYTDGSRGEIVLMAPDGRGTRTLQVAGSSLSLRDAWRAFDAAARSVASSPMITLAARMERSLGEVPVHGRMFADDSGRLWLKDYDVATDALPLRPGRLSQGGRWKVVTTGGAVVARITIPPNVAPIAVYADRMLAVLRDEFDVERFAVFRIER